MGFEIIVGVRNVTQEIALYEFEHCDRLGTGEYRNLPVEFYLHMEEFSPPEVKKLDNRRLITRVGKEWYVVEIYDIIQSLAGSVVAKGKSAEADFDVVIDVRNVTRTLLAPVRLVCLGDDTCGELPVKVYLHVGHVVYWKSPGHALVVSVNGKSYVIDVHDAVEAIAQRIVDACESA